MPLPSPALLPLSLLLASQPPPQHTVVAQAQGCTIALGAAEPDGVIPVWVDCRWPDRSPEALETILEQPDQHDAVWSRVRDARQLSRASDGGRLIWQRHAAELVADREVLVWWLHDEPLPGVQRWSWQTASEAEYRARLPVERGSVPCTRWEGAWVVQPEPDGGVRVVHENHYLPGGFPSALVRPFLAASVQTLLDELYAASAAGAP